MAAAFADPARARRMLRTPVLAVLAVLAVLGGASAAWTQGLTDDAISWALATGGFAAVVFAATVLVRDARGVRWAAGLIALLAVGLGIAGLVAATETLTPLAHREAGRWRPGSTFQYSPGLALLVVCALPALLTGMVRAKRWWAALACGFGGAVAGAVLALAESRTQLAFAMVVGAVALTRARHAAAVALVAAAGLGTYAVAGGYIPKTPPPDGTARLLAVAAVVVGAALAWLVARRWRVVVVLLLAAGMVAAIAKPAPRLISAGIAERPAPHAAPAKPVKAKHLHVIRDRLLHGRLRIWGEAIETFADRPLYGGGADSYLFASSEHQGPRAVYYAHDLPLEFAAELGIAGLLLALALYWTAGRALWRSRAGPGAWLLLPAAIAFLAANLVDWPWHLPGLGAVWALALGATLGASSATQNGH